jgi:hypothetical protein
VNGAGDLRHRIAKSRRVELGNEPRPRLNDFRHRLDLPAKAGSTLM